MEKIVEILKAVSDPTRLRILLSLYDKELCVCQIVALIELAPSTISKHISILKHAGLIESRKDGRWVYYCLNKKSGNIINNRLTDMLNSMLAYDEAINRDRIKLDKILSENQEDLCAKMKCGKN
jgi:ArsR family transcriptional regulator, arsenate/arsenite/antimonite-responsive transcriptional repressor